MDIEQFVTHRMPYARKVPKDKALFKPQKI